MQMRRFTRLTNGFSKKLENHQAAVALWIAFYNLCRVHDTLRCTPAMALGVSDHIWTIAELAQAALEPSHVPPLPRSTLATTLRSGLSTFQAASDSGQKSRLARDGALLRWESLLVCSMIAPAVNYLE
jgi:hypothetical protein